MNFGDDPLADLSDGSNDSFFDDPKPGPKRASLTKTPEKKSISDLFNLGETTSKINKSEDWLGLEKKSTTPKLSKKISFDDDDDILGTLGLSKRPGSRGENTISDLLKPPGKKIDILDSILGPSKLSETDNEIKKSSFDDLLRESKARVIEKDDNSLFSDGLSIRENRRGRRSSGSGLADPLGLFTSSNNEKEASNQVQIIKSVPNIPKEESLPDWLGGNAIKESKSEDIMTIQGVAKEEKPLMDEPLNSLLVQQKLSQSNIDYQNASMSLQQQESQVLMALQLKKYEENLANMEYKQQEVLLKQEQQFATLLEKQYAKQQILENNMRLQQERINNHIQLLIGQPHVVNRLISEEDEAKKNEDIVLSLKQRQQEEMFLLEESYKKQISLMEDSLDSIEKRLKLEISKITDSFESKVENLLQQQSDLNEKYKQKVQESETQHIAEIKQLREHHQQIIDELKYEHSILYENMKEIKKSETNFFSDSNTYLQKLDSNIEILYSNSKSLCEIKGTIEKDYGILSTAREESLRGKEKEVLMMRETLEKCRAQAEQERSELLGLVRALETKLAEQNQNAREDRWAFQQAASTLAARSSALDREAKFSRAGLERERAELDTLKATLLSEQEKGIQRLAEEKLALIAEKSRLETLNKLGSDFNVQKVKAEAEAAIRVAKEATEMTDREREALQAEKCEVERLKRTLIEQERKLGLREKDLEGLVRNAAAKGSEGENAIIEARKIEGKYNERLKELQNQTSYLANRERKLAEEKISISRERLALNTMIRQSKRCKLCEVDCKKLETDEHEGGFELVKPYAPKFDDMDHELLRLRLSTIEDERSTSLNDK